MINNFNKSIMTGLALISAAFLAFLCAGPVTALAAEMAEHEELYEKYKNAPAGSAEKEEYYRRYSAAYADYIKNAGREGDTQKNGLREKSATPASSTELYDAYKNEKDPAKKNELYEEYIKAYQRERSEAAGDKNSGNLNAGDKKSSEARTAETAEELKARAERSYEKYKNAPAGSAEKERYYEQYQNDYKRYRAKVEQTNATDTVVISNADAVKKQRTPYFAATDGYLADTPNTPVPAVSGGGGGGNILKKIFRKAEQTTEKLIGAQTTAALELLYGVNKDPALNARLNRVAERIAAVSDRRDIGYNFKILKMDEVNAFAVPGGTIYVTSAMMDFLSSDSELAFVLGHEMGHQVCRHSIKAFEKAMLVDYFIRNSKAGVIKNNKQALEIANLFLSMQYSRENEFESDRYGFKYATMAGYNPYASVAFFEKLKNKYEKNKTPAFLRLFQTHPSTHDRLIESQNMANAFSAANPQWKQYETTAK